MAAMEEPILSRLIRLDNILKQLEDMKSLDHSPKSSCASTFSSGTLTSSDVDGQASSVDYYSPKILEKHCRPINEVILEVEHKGTLIERLVRMEDRVLKICLRLEEELEAEKHRDEAAKNSPKKVLKKMLKTCVGGGGGGGRHGKHKIKS